MELYEQMRQAADAALTNSAADRAQVLVTLTENGDLSVFSNDLSPSSEDLFLSQQRQPLTALLCVWSGGAIDVPSMHVRKGLLQANPKNADAVIYLLGEHGINTRLLRQTF